MIDDLVAELHQEQIDDDNKKEYCAVQFDSTDDQRKALERSLSDNAAAIADAEEGISTLSAEIKALEDGIKELDKSVAEATEQRKEEHADYKELVANDSAAKEVILFAKNRLNKFYNPKLYKPPTKRELDAEDRIVVDMGGTLAPTAAPGGISGTGITAFAQKKDAPPPPPETYGAYTKKVEGSAGVIAMMDLLIKDLDTELAEAAAEEKDAQADYETMMQESAQKRADDSKSLTDKEHAKAELEAALQEHESEKASLTKELAALAE